MNWKKIKFLGVNILERNKITKDQVLQSNKKFYDQIADVYDSVDSRRSQDLSYDWLEQINFKISELIKKRFLNEEIIFVDAGAGSGFLSKKAKKYFRNIHLIDLSPAMLDKIQIDNANKIVGDCTKMPFQDQTIHCVGAFATLHHLYDPLDFFKDAYRVLKPGGFVYTDHDIEYKFVRYFKIPLKIYRYFFDHGPKYISACPECSITDYELSEYHGEIGISGEKLVKALRLIGFTTIEVSYHWEGGGFPEKILGFLKLKKFLSRAGFAPNLRIIASK